MKFLRFLLRFLLSVIISIALLALVLYVSGNTYLIKAVRSTYLVGKTGPTIADYHKFENRKVRAGRVEKWSESKATDFYLSAEEQANLEKWNTVALLIIQDDSIRFESYWDDYSKQSYSNSFSVAKSLVSLAVGAAIEKGCIRSLDQKVKEFIPELKASDKGEVSIRDLLNMSSGIDFGESYGDPFGFMAQTYYGKEIKERTLEKELVYLPGEVWKYQGGNTLLLSFLLREACGSELSNIFSEQIWKEIGASKDALWTIAEEEGLEKSYCCFYSNARDFARIGKLLLDSGKWNGKQLIAPAYFEEAFKPANIKDESGKLIDHYALHWWLAEYKGKKIYYARGIQGQYIVMIPEWDMVLVRLGHKRDPEVGAKVPVDLYDYLSIAARLHKSI